jgi:small-conductance mechanosensitive channel
VAILRSVLLVALALTALPARAAVLDDNDTSRLAGINEAIKSFEDDVSSALHDLPSNDAEQIESYAYVELNLEAAHERLNTIFMLVAFSTYVESSSDQLLILNVMHAQLLRQSKNYLSEKADAIASMAATHPADKVFATYRARATALLGDRAIPLLDELYRKTGDPQP